MTLGSTQAFAADLGQYRDVCAASGEPAPRADIARCLAKVRIDERGTVLSLAAPNGLSPADLTSAYNVPSSGTSTGIIAIVDAFDNPNVESDLGVYRATYGLPLCATANGCFKKVNQYGAASPLPAADSAWAAEIALDTQLASAICPACTILLVEADGASMANLGTAVTTAVRMGASVVSNSWGGLESEKSAEYDRDYFTHDHVTIFASSGDGGYGRGVEFPASGARVIGVGGTSLTRASNARGWAETVWGGSDTGASGTGSGCSNYIARPPWVTAADSPNCGRKTVADISAVADPKTGVAVFHTYDGGPGWTTYGGTSVGTPIVAAVFVAAGKGAGGGAFIWNNRTAFYDVTTGTNANGTPGYGPPCSVGTNNLCNGVTGFDAPSGWGTPNASALLGIEFDAGPRPDAGAFDAGPPPDGDSEPPDATFLPDAGVSPDAGSGREPGPNQNATDGGSSGCSVSDPSHAAAGAGAALAMAVTLLTRRRRRPRSSTSRISRL